MIGSCLFLNGDIEKINGGADIFDSITEKKLVMSRCLLSKRTEKDETFFTGNTQEGNNLVEITVLISHFTERPRKWHVLMRAFWHRLRTYG